MGEAVAEAAASPDIIDNHSHPVALGAGRSGALRVPCKSMRRKTLLAGCRLGAGSGGPEARGGGGERLGLET